jgi:hypothetical protein
MLCKTDINILYVYNNFAVYAQKSWQIPAIKLLASNVSGEFSVFRDTATRL